MSSRTVCIPVTPFGWTMWILTAIPIIILLPVSLYGLTQSLKLKQALLKYIYWITSFLLLLASILWSAHAFFDFDISRYCADWTRIMITNCLALTAYLFSLIFICCLYTVRVYLSFKSTKYSVTAPIFVVFAFMVSIQFVMVLFTLYFNILARRAVVDHTQEALKWAHLLFLTFNIFGAVNMLYNIMLLIILLRQMYKMISCLKDDNKKIDYIRKMVKPVAFYTICLLSVLLSTTIVFVFSFFRGNVVVDTNSLYQLNMAVVSWDILINDMSINLQFDASRHILDLYCKCCNNCLVRIFVQKIIGHRNRIQRVQSDIQMAQEQSEVTTLTHPTVTTTDKTTDTTTDTTSFDLR